MLEPLEHRIAPAAISIAGKTATWTDFDGDKVTLTWTSQDQPTFTNFDSDLGLRVSRILLDPAKHDGASFTIEVKAAGAFGDGRVEIGHLDGPGVALKSWVGAKAGISEIDLGNGTVGIGTLVMGDYGQTRSSFFTNAMGDDEGHINGSVGNLKINGDLAIGTLTVGDSGSDKMGRITIAGSLRGDITTGAPASGALVVKGLGGTILIRGDINAGTLGANFGQHKSVTVRGDIINEAFLGFGGAVIVAADQVTIGGSIVGGKVFANQPTSVFVGGSIIAKDQRQDTGVLEIDGFPASVTVKGGIFGGVYNDWKVTGSLLFAKATAAGAIVIDGSAGKVTVGGSIHAGAIFNADRAVNGGISASGNIGVLKVNGSITGNDKTPAFILVTGFATSANSDFVAIGKLIVKGSATHAYVAAGTGFENLNPDGIDGPQTMTTFNADSGIGPVRIGGNFVNSNFFAGVHDTSALGVGTSNASDTLATGDPARTAKIGAVTIVGRMLSDRTAATFAGFAADVIASITVGGRQVFKAGDGLVNFDTFLTAKEL